MDRRDPVWGAMIGLAGANARFRPEMESPDRMDWFRHSIFTALSAGASVIYLHNIAGHPPGQRRVTSAVWTACPFADEMLPVIAAARKAFPRAEWWLHASVRISEADPRLGYKSPEMVEGKLSVSDNWFPAHMEFWRLQLETLSGVVGRARFRVVGDEGGALSMQGWGGFSRCVRPYTARPVCEAIPMQPSGRLGASMMVDWREADRRGYGIVREGHADDVGLQSAVPTPIAQSGRAWLSLELPAGASMTWHPTKIEQWMVHGWNVIAADTAYHGMLAKMCAEWKDVVV